VEIQFRKTNWITADPGGRAVVGVGLRPFACWDCGFESRRGHGCLALVSIVCFWVEVSVSGGSLPQKSSTECGVSGGDREASMLGSLTRVCYAINKIDN
jgi:hypothetical protein